MPAVECSSAMSLPTLSFVGEARGLSRFETGSHPGAAGRRDGPRHGAR